MSGLKKVWSRSFCAPVFFIVDRFIDGGSFDQVGDLCLSAVKFIRIVFLIIIP